MKTGDKSRKNYHPLLRYLFKDYPAVVVFQDTHLMNGNFVQFYQSFWLRNTLVDEHSIQVLHVR